MAKSGTMDVETEDGSLANGTSSDQSAKSTKSEQPSDEDNEDEQDLEKYTKALLASLSMNDSEDLLSAPEETSEENHYVEEDYNALQDSLIPEDNKITTATSLIVESLLQDLCQVYIPDAEQSRRYYQMICQILFQMRVIDESYKMREFEGMRNQYQRVFHHLLNSPVGSSIPAWPSNDVTNEWSHYHREFDEIKYIAGGGFGRVYLVKHKLDSSDYAVKKISIRSEGIKSVMKYLSEVKTFAALNHANIVQYKAAWLELGENASSNNNNNKFSDNSDDSASSDGSSSNFSVVSKGINSDIGYIYPDVISTVETSFKQKKAADSSDFEINFQESPHYSYDATRSRSVKRTKRQSISEGNILKNGTICTMQDIKNMRLEGRQYRATVGGQKWATLFIQMALCPSTLQQWLQQRNLAEELSERSVTAALVPIGGCHVRYVTILEILKQLLKGLKYIHSKKIVHHDIKPSNIFIQEDNGSMLVQLGDFGLACPLQSARHSIAGGTKLYAAPEQIQGTCVSKSDMYSLGIVLLELAASFRTDMERVRSITDLRKTHGQSAADVLIHSSGINGASAICQSRIASIISQVMIRAHADRPDANGLLVILSRMASESNCPNSGTEAACRDSSTCVDMTILVKELRTQLAQKDAEIFRLRELLKEAGIPGDVAA